MQGDVILGVPLAFTILAVIATLLRVYVRARMKTGLGWDDWTMLLAAVIEIVNRALTTMSTLYANKVPLTPEDGVEALKYNYVALPFQVAVSVFARLSITILSIRLFGVHKWFRQSVITLFCIIALLSIAFIPMTFSQVTPVQSLWDPFIIDKHQRLDPDSWMKYAAFTQSVYTVSDLVLFLLPVIIIWKLNMPLHQKVGLGLVMALGLFAMVMSIMRTVWIVLSYSSASALDNYNDTAILTLALIEGDMVIIIGCIPPLRSFMNHKFPATLSLQYLFTKSKSDSRRQAKTSTADKSSGISGAYLDLELSNRGRGALSQNGNAQAYATHFHPGNTSDDYLVDGRNVRKTEQFTVTYESPRAV